MVAITALWYYVRRRVLNLSPFPVRVLFSSLGLAPEYRRDWDQDWPAKAWSPSPGTVQLRSSHEGELNVEGEIVFWIV